MNKNNIFDDNSLKSLLDLVEIMSTTDDYKISITTSDSLLDLIDRADNMSKEEKEKLKSKINKRRSNQIKVEELAKKAKDPNKGKEYFNVKDAER